MTPVEGRAEGAGTLYVVPTPIGNLEDMTYRAVRVLGEVAVIAAEDTRRTRGLLEHFKIAGPAVLSYFDGNEVARTAALLARLRAGQDVALVSDAGMPGISDPGQHLVAAAIAAGVQTVVLAGASAGVCALVGSGLPSDEFRFVGFLPREEGARHSRLGGLRGELATLVLYEAPGRVGMTLHDLSLAFGADRPACVARELTKIHEEYARGSLGELARRYGAQAPLGEVVIVVGGADPRAADQAIVDIEAETRRRLSEGQGPKEIAAALALETGKPRRQLYQLALSLKR